MIKILDAIYEKADLPKVVNKYCSHLSLHQCQKHIKLLQNFEELFDGTLNNWKTEPVQFELKPDAKPYHGRVFPVPHVYLETLKKEVDRLVEIGVLKHQQSSEWSPPTFIIPKKNQTVRFISDFRDYMYSLSYA